MTQYQAASRPDEMDCKVHETFASKNGSGHGGNSRNAKSLYYYYDYTERRYRKNITIYGFRIWKNFTKRFFSDIVLLLESNTYDRNNIIYIKLESLIQN